MRNWLEIENISKSYGNVQALKGISFKSNNAGIIGLIGPNGAGKTTLFRIFLGLIKSDSGACRIMNYDVWKEADFLKSELGVLLERPSYPANLTVKKYLEYVTRLYGLTMADSEYDEWSHKFNLPFDRILSDLSAGMRRKVGLLVAIIANPKIVLMDEPTTNVDPIGREEIMRSIVEIHKKMDTKFIVSSHLLVDIEKITDEVIILVDGLIIDSGGTSSLLNSYGEKNKYICTSLNPETFSSLLRKQDWVKSVKLEINQIKIETHKLDHYRIFENIVEIAKKNKIVLLSLQKESSLTQVLRS